MNPEAKPAATAATLAAATAAAMAAIAPPAQALRGKKRAAARSPVCRVVPHPDGLACTSCSATVSGKQLPGPLLLLSSWPYAAACPPSPGSSGRTILARLPTHAGPFPLFPLPATLSAQLTPVWRAGPQGPKTLCTACGVRYMKVAKTK